MATRTRWTPSLIRSELLHIAKEFGRMPSANEIRAAGRNDLATAITKGDGMKAWAQRLGLRRKNSETLRGHKIEEDVAAWMRGRGLRVERQTAKAPFDLLVNGTLRVDVKSSTWKSYKMPSGSICSGYMFGISKRDPTCDLYLLCGVDEDNKIECRYFVPAEFARVSMITAAPNSKYNRFREKDEFLFAAIEKLAA